MHSAFPPREPRSTNVAAVPAPGNRRRATEQCRESMKMPVPDVQRLMRYAGLDPEHGLLRWGNYDRTSAAPVDGLRGR